MVVLVLVILLHISMIYQGFVFSPLLESIQACIKVLPFNHQKIESHTQKILFWKNTSRDESREMRIRSLHKW